MKKNDFNFLKKLCQENGTSGNEKNIKNIIIKEISPYVENVKVDNLGNIIVFKEGEKKPNTKLLIAAHMDEIGLICTFITEDGYIGFDKIGGIEDKILPGLTVNIGKNNIPGVIGIKPIHLCDTLERKTPVSSQELLIDIGATSKKQALKYVDIGDHIYFKSEFNVSNGIISGKALDDRAGCSILVQMIKSNLAFDTYFAFTVQEEIGLRGAKVACHNVNPDSAIVVEATTACDIPEVSPSNQICKINEGVVISFMDKRTIYDKEYYNLAIDSAKQNKIKYQIKQGVSGGNDAGAIQTSRNGVRTLALSVPCRYLHTPKGIISQEDYFSTANLAMIMAEKICDIPT